MERYTIGIDAGGTHSTAVARSEGKELFRAEGDAMNGNAVCWEQVEENLRSLLKKFVAAGYTQEACCGIGVGIAGISNPIAKVVVENGVRGLGYSCPLKVVSDGESALYGAIPQSRGILLIAGTGSICYGRKMDGSIVRCGGYGHLVDDKGSAYDAGIQMLQEVVCAYDGRRPATKLTEAVMNFWSISSMEELVAKIYAKDTGKKEIAQLALLMEKQELIQLGCLQEIQKNCVAAWMELVRTILGKLEGEALLAVSGSLLTKNQGLLELFVKNLAWLPGITLVNPKMDAANGAAELAARNASCEWHTER